MNSGSQSPIGGVQSQEADLQNPGANAGNGMPGLSSTVQGAKESAANLAGQAKQYAGDMTLRAKDKGRSMFEQQKDVAADQLENVADALRRTSGELQQSTNPQVARYIDMSADQLENFGNRLRNKNLDSLLNDTQNLARRHPGAFLAGTMAAGFIIARFLKSSSDRHFAASSQTGAQQVGTIPVQGTYPVSNSSLSPSTEVIGGATPHLAGTSTDTAGAMSGDLDISSNGDRSSPATPNATSSDTIDTGAASQSRRNNQGGNFYGDR
jgi:hypothetical protein